MAIIRTFKTASGVVINIHDDCMAAPGSEEEKRTIEAQRRVAYNILVSAAKNEESKEG